MIQTLKASLTLIALFFAAGETGVAQGANPSKSYLMVLAEQLGRAAGDAEFCGHDADKIEDFIAKSYARLARETEDKFLLAGGRVEFNSHAAYGRADGPDGGCDAFSIDFAKIRGSLLY